MRTKSMNKIVSVIILACFLLNTVVSDLAFGLAIPSSLSDIAGIELKDMGRIKLALEEQLMAMERELGPHQGMGTFYVRIAGKHFSEKTIFNPADMQFFGHELKITKGGPCVRVRLKDKYGTRDYYATFSFQRDIQSGFPIYVYTEEQYKSSQGLTVARPQTNPKDAAEVNRYVEQNEKIIDPWLAGKMKDAQYAACQSDKGPQYANAAFYYSSHFKEKLVKVLRDKVVSALKTYKIDLVHEDEIFSAVLNRKLVFVLAEDNEVPMIEEKTQDGKTVKINVYAHSSANATYIVLNKVMWNNLVTHDSTQYFSEDFLNRYIATGIHEVGPLCGLEHAVDIFKYTERAALYEAIRENHKIINLLDVLVLGAMPALAQMVHEAQTGALETNDYISGIVDTVRNMKPVNLDDIRGRDYEASAPVEKAQKARPVMSEQQKDALLRQLKTIIESLGEKIFSMSQFYPKDFVDSMLAGDYDTAHIVLGEWANDMASAFSREESFIKKVFGEAAAKLPPYKGEPTFILYGEQGYSEYIEVAFRNDKTIVRFVPAPATRKLGEPEPRVLEASRKGNPLIKVARFNRRRIIVVKDKFALFAAKFLQRKALPVHPHDAGTNYVSPIRNILVGESNPVASTAVPVYPFIDNNATPSPAAKIHALGGKGYLRINNPFNEPVVVTSAKGQRSVALWVSGVEANTPHTKVYRPYSPNNLVLNDTPYTETIGKNDTILVSREGFILAILNASEKDWVKFLRNFRKVDVSQLPSATSAPAAKTPTGPAAGGMEPAKLAKMGLNTKNSARQLIEYLEETSLFGQAYVIIGALEKAGPEYAAKLKEFKRLLAKAKARYIAELKAGKLASDMVETRIATLAWVASKRLLAIGDKKAINSTLPVLGWALSRAEAPARVLSVIAKTLTKIGKDAVPELIDASLQEEDTIGREYAVIALGNIGKDAKKAVEYLERLITQARFKCGHDTKLAAIEAIWKITGSLPTKEHIEKLKDIMRMSDDIFCRSKAWKLLFKAGALTDELKAGKLASSEVDVSTAPAAKTLPTVFANGAASAPKKRTGPAAGEMEPAKLAEMALNKDSSAQQLIEYLKKTRRFDQAMVMIDALENANAGYAPRLALFKQLLPEAIAAVKVQEDEKAWYYLNIASLAKTLSKRADLLDLALKIAWSIPQWPDSPRCMALSGIASRVFKYNPKQAAGIFDEAIQAAGEDEDVRGRIAEFIVGIFPDMCRAGFKEGVVKLHRKIMAEEGAMEQFFKKAKEDAGWTEADILSGREEQYDNLFGLVATMVGQEATEEHRIPPAMIVETVEKALDIMRTMENSIKNAQDSARLLFESNIRGVPSKAVREDVLSAAKGIVSRARAKKWIETVVTLMMAEFCDEAEAPAGQASVFKNVCERIAETGLEREFMASEEFKAAPQAIRERAKAEFAAQSSVAPAAKTPPASSANGRAGAPEKQPYTRGGNLNVDQLQAIVNNRDKTAKDLIDYLFQNSAFEQAGLLRELLVQAHDSRLEEFDHLLAAVRASSAEKPAVQQHDLKIITRILERDVINMISKAGSGHPGGSLSMLKMIAALYFGSTNDGKRIMRFNPADPTWPNRDRFILSKGHAAPGLYAALGRRGFFPTSEFDNLRKLGSMLQGHTDMTKTPGVDMSAGSLGVAISAAVGMALAAKMDNRDYTTYVMLGDGETQEGQVAESARFAAAMGLDNIIAFLDWNGMQIDGKVTNVDLDYDGQAKLWEARGWNAIKCDGEEMSDVIRAITQAKNIANGKPTIIIAKTIKGSGLPGMEKHGAAPAAADVKIAMDIIDKDLESLAGRGFDADTYINGILEKAALPSKEMVDINLANKAGYEKRLDSYLAISNRPGTQSIIGDARKTYAADKKVATRTANGDELVFLGANDINVVALCADLRGSVMFDKFAKAYGTFSATNPTGRYIPVGISEALMTSLAAGLAACGKIPMIGTFSVFTTRMPDQLNAILNTKLPIIIVGTHGGLATGPDGRTHQDAHSFGVLGALPNVQLYEGADAEETRVLARHIYNIARHKGGIHYIRPARLDTPIIAKPEGWQEGVRKGFYALYDSESGRQNTPAQYDLVLVSTGVVAVDAVAAAKELAAKGKKAKVINVTHLNEISGNAKEFASLISNSKNLISVIDALPGILGDKINRVLVSEHINMNAVRALGIKDYGESAMPAELYKLHGFDKAGILNMACSLIGMPVPATTTANLPTEMLYLINADAEATAALLTIATTGKLTANEANQTYHQYRELVKDNAVAAILTIAASGNLSSDKVWTTYSNHLKFTGSPIIAALCTMATRDDSERAFYDARQRYEMYLTNYPLGAALFAIASFNYSSRSETEEIYFRYLIGKDLQEGLDPTTAALLTAAKFVNKKLSSFYHTPMPVYDRHLKVVKNPVLAALLTIATSRIRDDIGLENEIYKTQKTYEEHKKALMAAPAAKTPPPAIPDALEKADSDVKQALLETFFNNEKVLRLANRAWIGSKASTDFDRLFVRFANPQRADKEYIQLIIYTSGISHWTSYEIYMDGARVAQFKDESAPDGRKALTEKLRSILTELTEGNLPYLSQWAASVTAPAALPVSGKAILQEAKKLGRPVLACNIDNGELSAIQIRGMMKAAIENNAYIMFEVGPGALKTYAEGKPQLPEYCRIEAEKLYSETGKRVVYAVHLDHNQINENDYKKGTDEEKKKALAKAIDRAKFALVAGFTSFATDTSTLTKLEKQDVRERLADVVDTGSEILAVIYKGAKELGISVGNEGEVGDIGKEVISTVEEAVGYYKGLVERMKGISEKLGIDFTKEPLIDVIALNIGTSHGYDFDEKDRLVPYKPGRINLERAREVSEAFKKLDLNIGVALHGFSGTPLEFAKDFVNTGIAKVNINTDWQAITWKVLEAYYPDLYKKLFMLAREAAKKDKEKAGLVTEDAENDYKAARNRIMFSFARVIFRDKKYHPLLEEITNTLKNGEKRLSVAKEQKQEDHVNIRLTLDNSAPVITAHEAIEMLTHDRVANLMQTLGLQGSAEGVVAAQPIAAPVVVETPPASSTSGVASATGGAPATSPLRGSEVTMDAIMQTLGQEAALEIDAMSTLIAGSVKQIRQDIPTHKDTRYTLLVDSNLYRDGECDKDKNTGYMAPDGAPILAADRFDLEQVDTSNLKNILAHIKEPARTVIQASGELSKEDLEELKKQAPGIRILRIDTREFRNDRDLKDDTVRQQYRFDLYAAMIAARRITEEDRQANNVICRYLEFFIRTHINSNEPLTASDYIQALLVDDVAKLIKISLSYKPAGKYDVPSYHNFAASLISA